MTTKLRLAPDFTLPAEAVTETFGILAVRGAGKSNTAAVMAEEMFRAKLPFVVVDPVSSWYGLRSSKDGKGPGLAIPIFGGKHGDVPLERTGGQLVADLIVDQRLSCVLDIGTFESEAARKAFLLDFARRLYLRNEHPLHLFLEEADDYIPQRPMRDEALLLRAWENIVRRGRSRGLGMTLITQRSAAINKSVLTQIGTLIAMRTTGPQDRAAIEEWLKYHDQSREILASLPGMPDGDAWVWSPRFLGKTVRVHFRQRETYDSGATPKASATPRAPATLADVDLGDITKKMAATIEKAKAEDPRELRRQVAELRAQLAAAQKASPAASAAKERRVEIKVAVYKEAHVRRLEVANGKAGAILDRAERIASQIRDAVQAVAAAREMNFRDEHVAREAAKPAPSTPPHVPAYDHMPARAVAPPRPTSARQVAGGVAQRILNALAELEQLGAKRPARELVAFLAGYSHLASKGFVNAVSSLRTEGLIEYPDSDSCVLTDEGRRRAEPPARPRSPEELQARVIEMLGGASGRILAPLIRVYPKPMARTDVAAEAGYGHLASKGFVNAVSRLRTLGFIDYPDTRSMVAMPVLFLEG